MNGRLLVLLIRQIQHEVLLSGCFVLSRRGVAGSNEMQNQDRLFLLYGLTLHIHVETPYILRIIKNPFEVSFPGCKICVELFALNYLIECDYF